MSFRKAKTPLVLIALSCISTRAMGYEEDTHFLLTYVLCRTGGMTDAESLKIAAVDQGMDDSSGTVANGGTGGVIPNVPEEWKWHALDRDGKMGPRGIKSRMRVMFATIKSRKTADQKLFLFGVFMHYQQDTWAHRHHYDKGYYSEDAYVTYNTPFGHAFDGHQPDRPPFEPVAAIYDVEESIKYVKWFITDCLGRPVRPFARYYKDMGGSIDNAWPDSRNGKYFHQLSSTPRSSAAEYFFTELIRAQVNAYTTSIDYSPSFLGRFTADEAKFDKMRVAFQSVCDDCAGQIGERIIVPSKDDKVRQGFTNLTTAQIEDAMK